MVSFIFNAFECCMFECILNGSHLDLAEKGDQPLFPVKRSTKQAISLKFIAHLIKSVTTLNCCQNIFAIHCWCKPNSYYTTELNHFKFIIMCF